VASIERQNEAAESSFVNRITRFQGAVIRNDHILLVKHHEYTSGHSYWVIPGGGREEGETKQECVKRNPAQLKS
jgi:ADP-ribose pyrophosphatase YjhB (NUDIX family)